MMRRSDEIYLRESQRIFANARIDEESLALADTVAAVLVELGSNGIDDLAGTMARHIAEMTAAVA